MGALPQLLKLIQHGAVGVPRRCAGSNGINVQR